MRSTLTIVLAAAFALFVGGVGQQAVAQDIGSMVSGIYGQKSGIKTPQDRRRSASSGSYGGGMSVSDAQAASMIGNIVCAIGTGAIGSPIAGVIAGEICSQVVAGIAGSGSTSPGRVQYARGPQVTAAQIREMVQQEVEVQLAAYIEARDEDEAEEEDDQKTSAASSEDLIGLLSTEVPDLFDESYFRYVHAYPPHGPSFLGSDPKMAEWQYVIASPAAEKIVPDTPVSEVPETQKGTSTPEKTMSPSQPPADLPSRVPAFSPQLPPEGWAMITPPKPVPAIRPVKKGPEVVCLNCGK